MISKTSPYYLRLAYISIHNWCATYIIGSKFYITYDIVYLTCRDSKIYIMYISCKDVDSYEGRICQCNPGCFPWYDACISTHNIICQFMTISKLSPKAESILALVFLFHWATYFLCSCIRIWYSFLLWYLNSTLVYFFPALFFPFLFWPFLPFWFKPLIYWFLSWLLFGMSDVKRRKHDVVSKPFNAYSYEL